MLSALLCRSHQQIRKLTVAHAYEDRKVLSVVDDIRSPILPENVTYSQVPQDSQQLREDVV